MDKHTKLDSVTEYETGWFDAGYNLVEQPDGSQKKYYWACLRPAITVVAIKQNGNILLVEQYRPVVDETFVECPTGMVENGENIKSAAARELEEETGYKPDTVHILETKYIANGILQHQRTTTVATGLTKTEQNLDDNEFLKVVELTPREAIETARKDPVSDATLTALLLAQYEEFVDF